MSSQQVTRTTERGTQIIDIHSLEELADYSLKDVEVHPFIPFGGQPRIVVLEKGANDIYRIGDDVYKALKHEYIKSGSQNSKVDALIESIDARLKPLRQS